MSRWTKEQLENMLEDVVNELDLCEAMIEKHSEATPAQLVRLILGRKEKEITLLKHGVLKIEGE